MMIPRMTIGQRIDRLATRVLTPIAARMARSRRLGNLALSLSHGTGMAALGIGYHSWETGTALQNAAVRMGFENFTELMQSYDNVSASYYTGPAAQPAGYLEKGWVIANHKLVAFHAAFISSVLSLPESVSGKLDTLKFMFLSSETVISLAMLYTAWHTGIAIHEIGHYVTAAKLSALNKASQDSANAMKERGFLSKVGWYAKMFAKVPWGRFEGVKKEGGNFTPDAPFNLAVAASGPRWSGWLAAVTLPIAAVALASGLVFGSETAIMVGRFFLAPGIIGLLDRIFADPGKLNAYRKQEAEAAERARAVSEQVDESGLLNRLLQVRQMMKSERMRTVTLADGSTVSSPWQYRNSAMGGRHTEKEYPESNISMQEGMFIPLSAKTYEEAQEMTVRLQTRLKQIIEGAPGARVMGIGLEGGLAPYIEKGEGDMVPEQRLWRMMKQAILDCGFKPGVDVAIALDPAASELENMYREEYEQPNSVGMYLFWRDKGKVIMSRDEVLALYRTAIERDGVPIVSIEDGFGELDHQGWNLLMQELGDRILIVGDDLVTTNDAIIEGCARKNLTNASLIKANQIGTLTETVLAMLTSWAYGAELIVSHRSKSPNDPFEAEISTAMNALGLKAGGGANTERLQKYGRVVEILTLAEASQREMTLAERAEVEANLKELVRSITGRDDFEILPEATEAGLSALMMRLLAVEAVRGREEPTNAGIPTGAVTILLDRTGTIRFSGGVPLGTSAGLTEAIHYVDSIIQPGSVVDRHSDLFKDAGDGTFRFAKEVRNATIRDLNDPELTALWERAQRYSGKGCLAAVEHIEQVLGQAFTGRRLSEIGSLLDVDRTLLRLERERAVAGGHLDNNAPYDEQVQVMQRKGNLGMNAVLSMSLALGRAVAARDGKELWQLIRDQAKITMANFIAAHSQAEGHNDVAALMSMDINDLRQVFAQVANELITKGEVIHALLREQLPVYDIPEEVRLRGIFTDKTVLSQINEDHRYQMEQLNEVFKIEGSVVYDVEIRDEMENGGIAYPYIRLRETSRRGLGEGWHSRTEGQGFVRAYDHKGQTIVDNNIWIDSVNAKKRGPQFEGAHFVAVPQRLSERQGTITLVIGRFDESLSPERRLEMFDYKYQSMLRFAMDRGHDKTPELEQLIREAFIRVPLHDLYEMAGRRIYDEYIAPTLPEQDA
ncbi:MAG: hypothetical protein JW782_07415 [Candidatus Saganbacteria bacterium]|nr:hypothetical protein [Candidatus Saganbacteria bacterium]